MRACGHRRTLRNHLLRIHISNTLTFAKSRAFFCVTGFQIIFRPPLPRRQVTFFTWFSHALLLWAAHTWAWSGAHPFIIRADNTESKQTKFHLYGHDVRSVCQIIAFFLCLEFHLLMVEMTRHAHHSLRLYSLRNQEQNTRSAKHPHLSAHAPSNLSDILWGMVI